VALVVAVAALAGAEPASAGTYDVVSCGAPGANGVNRAWQVYPGFDDRFWDAVASCPELLARSEPRPGVTAPYFTGAGFHVKAPAGTVLDRLVIWRKGYRFDSTDPGRDGWAVGGYRGDGTVIGGRLFGEACNFPEPPDRLYCELPDGGARVEHDVETNEILYSVSCFHQPGCGTANDQGYPFAQVTISGSIVTVRDDRPPDVVARGPLTEPGWHVDDAPLSFGASDSTGLRQVRVLVDGAQVHEVAPGCDYTRMAPCNPVPERAVQLGAAVPDGTHTLTVEATDAASNVARADRTVTVDRNPPALEFLPAKARRRIVVAAPDAGSGTTGGSIEVRRRRSFRALPTRLRNGRLVARIPRGSVRRLTFRANAVDAVGHRAVSVGTPVRLRAGFGRKLRRSARVGLKRGVVVRGRLRAFRGRSLRGREITVLQRVRADGTPRTLLGRGTTGRGGRFRIAVPPGPSRILSVISPGVGGLQAARRNLNLRVPWSSTLRIAPRAVAPGGRIELSGRLRLRGMELPRSGKRVELQAFDGGRWRVFATTRARGRRAAWQASYRFGTRSGSYPIRVRIPYEGTIPFDRGYSRPVRVTVG
jgi:hypothetical protein